MRSAPRSSRRAYIAAALIAFVTIGGREVFAAPPRPMKPEARAALERGLAAYDEGDYVAASAALREAIRIEPHPDLYYTLGQSERRAGRCDEAAEAYRAFLASNPPAAEASLARDNMERCVPAAPPPEPAPIAPRPRPKVDEVAAPDDAAASSGGADVTAFLVPGAGLAVAIFGGVAIGLGEGAASSATEATTLEAFRDASTRTDVWRVTGGLALAGGLGLAIGSVVATLTERDAPPRPAVSLQLGPGFVGITGAL